MLWLMSRRVAAKDILTEAFVQQLHVKMFGKVWRWAGQYRKTNKNIGVDKYEIPTQLKMLLDDCRYWIEHKTYEEEEIAIRFKHRLVSIHCFPNGNGRHSRLMADVIAERLFARDVFSWGSNDLANLSAARANYLAAVKAADAGEIRFLIAFARS